MGERTLQDLKMKQALPLDAKVLLTKSRIREWVNHYGVDGVCVSFSGGKDSTVLLHLVREMYPNIEAVFVDTGLEYPEIREFVKTFDNVTWIKPNKTFKRVIDEYGYPFISKEVSRSLNDANRMLEKYSINWDELSESEHYKNLAPIKVQYLLGIGKNPHTGKISHFNIPKWGYIMKSHYKFSNMCCDVMKKQPIKKHLHDTGKHSITAQMASESKRRTTQWVINGCNGFDMKEPISNPMSFWTEQDVLMYIKLNNIPIASVYGDIVAEEKDELAGQETWSTLGIFDTGMPTLKTTGCQRTGCMFCGYGCHLEKGKGRFELMKETHPKQYEWIMKPWSEGGLGYKDVIDWLNENGNLNIKY